MIRRSSQNARKFAGKSAAVTPLNAAAAHWRFRFVVLMVALCFAAIVWRLIDLQLVNRDFLRKQGEVRTVRIETIDATRGMITDRAGDPLAVSTPVETVWADPSESNPADPRWLQVAKLLDLPSGDLIARLRAAQNKEFLYIKRKIQPSLAEQVKALGVPGIYSRREFRRYYPASEVAAHLVGFTNIDEMGQEGLELAYDGWLSGEIGRKRVLKDNRGHIFKDLSLINDAQPGQTLALSIDLRLQYLAYRELKAAVMAHRASSGSLVMVDVRTGEVLAMVNQPAFNPNDRGKMSPAQLRNRAVTDTFEPGSTVKPFTVAAALESGRYQPTTAIDTTPGYMRVGGYTIRDHRNYGVLDLTQVITKSSNVGATRIAMDLTGDVVRDMFQRVGLAQPSGMAFPGEAIGVLPVRSRWRPSEVATLSYGYGLSVNTLQLAHAYTILANGGIDYPLSLLRLDQAPQGQRVLSSKVAHQVLQMLRTVVTEGTGTRAEVALYQSAGKTGTVHLVGRHGYEESEYKAIFAGIAPLAQPRIAAVVVIDAPQGSEYYGGEVAAPVFASVLGDALRLLNVRPVLDVAKGVKVAGKTDSSPDRQLVTSDGGRG